MRLCRTCLSWPDTNVRIKCVHASHAPQQSNIFWSQQADLHASFAINPPLLLPAGLWRFRDDILREDGAPRKPPVTESNTMIIRKDKLDGNELVYVGKGVFVRVRFLPFAPPCASNFACCVARARHVWSYS